MTPGRQRTLLWVGFTLAAYGRQQGAALEYVPPIHPAMPPDSGAGAQARLPPMCVREEAVPV